MADNSFFDESTEASQVKAAIVEKYFEQWASIITATQTKYGKADGKIGYVDLFAGPGRYKTGSTSTPLRILEKAISNPNFARRLVTVFNDKDDANVQSLRQAIAALPGIENLQHEPQIWHEEVGDKIAADFQRINTIPILAFVDPWGYKGLTLRLVNAFLKDWGCDCIFFFNYQRINAGLSNPCVHEHMCALFGEERAKKLAMELEPLTSQERVSMIITELATALRETGGTYRYVLPFGFTNETGKRTTHHLILVTKHFKGYEVMKDILAKASSENFQGVPSFRFIPANRLKQGLLFELEQPLTTLKQKLLNDMAGTRQSMRSIYESHSVDTPFISKNYKDVLKELEAEGRIIAESPPGKRRPKGTFGNDIMVTFPEKGESVGT